MRRLVVEIAIDEKLIELPVIGDLFKQVKSLELPTILRMSENEFAFIARITFMAPEYNVKEFPLFAWMEVQILDNDLDHLTYTIFVKGKPKTEPRRGRIEGEVPDLYITRFEYKDGKAKGSFLGSSKAIDTLLSSFDKLGIRYNVISLTNARFPLTSPLDGLTSKQYRVLFTAYREGYYDIPRKVNSNQLARKLGIANSTFAVHLRRAEKRIIVEIFGDR